MLQQTISDQSVTLNAVHADLNAAHARTAAMQDDVVLAVAGQTSMHADVVRLTADLASANVEKGVWQVEKCDLDVKLSGLHLEFTVLQTQLALASHATVEQASMAAALTAQHKAAMQTMDDSHNEVLVFHLISPFSPSYYSYWAVVYLAIL